MRKTKETLSQLDVLPTSSYKGVGFSFRVVGCVVYLQYMKNYLPVPYYSQFVDINDPFWMLRACGGLSLRMVAEFHGKQFPDFLSFCEDAKRDGGYSMVNGWVHDYLIEKAKSLGLQAYRKEGLTSIEEIVSSLSSGNPVIASIEKRVLEQKRFHMIVIIGYENGTIYYHESESTDKEKGRARSCSEAVFMDYWRGMAIFITP